MFLKQLTNKINYNTKIENKILSQTVYNKLFVRSNFLRNQDLKIIDNNSNFYLFKSAKNTLNFLNGNSCFLNIFLLKHKLNTHFNFEYLITFNLLKNSFSEEKFLFFKRLKKKKSIFFLLLYPVKGGYICFSLGVKAFLPLSHLKTILLKKVKKNKIRNLFNELFFNRFNFLCVNKKFNFIKNNLLFKLSGQLSKKFILSFLKRDKLFRKRTFNNIKSKKKSTILRYSNFIFLKKNKKKISNKNKIYSVSRGIKFLFNISKITKLKKIFKIIFFLRIKNLKKSKFEFLLKVKKVLFLISTSKFNNILKNILKHYVIALVKNYL